MSKAGFIANPMLVGAMELFKKEKTPQAQKVFIDELIHARLLAPVVITPPPAVDENGVPRLQPDSDIKIPLINTKDEKRYFMLFTDAEEVKKMSNGAKLPLFGFGFKDYADMVMKNENCSGAIINPSSMGMVASRELIAAILEKNPGLKKN